jgi:putative exporter of polyketide antibiotics
MMLWKRSNALPPLEPLPPLPAFEWRRKRRRILSWTTVLAAMSAIALGVFHGIGSKIAEEVWPHISAYLPEHF